MNERKPSSSTPELTPKFSHLVENKFGNNNFSNGNRSLTEEEKLQRFEEIDWKGSASIDLFRLRLIEMAEAAGDPNDNVKLGATVLVGQLAFNYLYSKINSGLFSADEEEKIKEVIERENVRNMGTTFYVDIEKWKEKIIQAFDKGGRGKKFTKDDRLADYTASLVQLAVKHTKWMDGQITSDNRDVILKQLELISNAGQAYDSLITSNLQLLNENAKRYIGRGLEVGDLISYGEFGLIKAAAKYNFRSGFRFSTYATWWIRQAMRRAIADLGQSIRIPVHVHDSLAKKRAREYNNTYDEEDIKDYSSEGGEKFSQIELAALRVSRIDSLNRQTDRDSYENASDELGDFIAAPDDTEEESLNTDLREIMIEILETLTPREKEVIILRFGIEDGIGRTLAEVGRNLNVTRERIRQIEQKALRKLRHYSRSKKLRAYR